MTKGSFACGACILAGGLSTRMGRDKTRLELGRRNVLSHVKTTVEQLGLPVRIIRRDLVVRCGPLGGVFTGLKTSQLDAELFLACDMPFIKASLLEELIEKFATDGKSLFVTTVGGPGFPFLIPVNALSVIEDQIHGQEFSLQKLAIALKANCVHLQRDQDDLLNINTPADWELAQKRWRE